MPDNTLQGGLRRAVVVGGSGGVGMLLSQSLRASGVEVLIADVHPPAQECLNSFTYLECDVVHEELELRQAIAAAESLFVCLPERVAIRAFPFLSSALDDHCLWVDTLSVKTDIARMLNENAGRFEAVSINPMFAPRVGWNEQCVAMVDLFTGPKSFAFKKFLEAWGARVEETTAREHDPLTSVIQVATHALVLSAGAALLSENLKLDRILNFATPPFKLLLVLMHRLTTQSPEVYWDIQAFHPLGHDMRNQLIAAIGDIQTGVQRQDPTEFLKLLEDLKKLFKDDEDVILEWTKRALTI